MLGFFAPKKPFKKNVRGHFSPEDWSGGGGGGGGLATLSKKWTAFFLRTFADILAQSGCGDGGGVGSAISKKSKCPWTSISNGPQGFGFCACRGKKRNKAIEGQSEGVGEKVRDSVSFSGPTPLMALSLYRRRWRGCVVSHSAQAS